MNPSQQQINSAVRTLLISVGSAIAGFVVAKGWITAAEASAILSNQQLMDSATTVIIALLGAGVSAGMGVWGVVSNKQTNLVQTVAAMPEVNKVELVPSQSGVDLANAVPSTPGARVTVAG
jgi:hypothetical protein